MRSCAAGAMLSPWRAGSVGCQLPGRFPRRTVPAAFPFFQISMIDKVLFTSIPAVPTAGNRRKGNLRKETRERTRPCGASSNFSCLCSSRLSCFRRAALGARLLSLQSHFKWEQAHSAYLSQTGAQANYSLKKFRAGH